MTISKGFSDRLVPALTKINEDFKDKGWEVKVHQGARSLAEQQKHLKSGASTVPVSLHNIGEAVDLVFYKDGQVVPIDSPKLQTKATKEMLESIGSKIEELGFTWGGRWSSPYDPWHVQNYESTKKYLETNKNMVPVFKNFIDDYKTTLKNSKDSTDKKKLTELIDFLENS